MIEEHLHKNSPPAGVQNVPLCDFFLVRIAFLICRHGCVMYIHVSLPHNATGHILLCVPQKCL